VESVSTQNAPAPGGHYSQAIIHDNVVYVAGQLPIDPETGHKKTGSIEEQTEMTLKNVAEIVKAAGSDIDHILKVTVYISDINLCARFDEAYARFFGRHRPARAIVPVTELPFGFKLEIDAIAALKNEK